MIRRKDAGTVGISHRAFRMEGYGGGEDEVTNENIVRHKTYCFSWGLISGEQNI